MFLKRIHQRTSCASSSGQLVQQFKNSEPFDIHFYFLDLFSLFDLLFFIIIIIIIIIMIIIVVIIAAVDRLMLFIRVTRCVNAVHQTSFHR